MDSYLHQLTAVILTYKTNLDILKNCLKSINPKVKILIVENSSHFKYLKEIQSNFSNIEVICSGSNLGYGGGNNFGLNKVKTNYALILNPDTVCEDNFFSNVNKYLSGNIDFTLQTGMLKEADSYSNLQRAFAFNISKEYFLRNPIIGIGTNNFILTLNNEHYYLPDFLMVGIHNEFFRIPVENGLVGLFLYLMIWYKSWTRTKQILIYAKINRLISKRQAVFLLYSIYITLAVYVGTEASSSRSFIILVIISILPDYLIHYFKKDLSK